MITLNTILYEGNFRDTLNKNSWFINFNSDMISDKMITVNNLESIKEFQEMLLDYPEIKIAYVNENVNMIKEKYSLDINEYTLGYYYTIPYFVAIEECNTEFILNIASDCMSDIHISDSYFIESLKEINRNPLCSTTMVSWVKDNRIMPNGLTVGQHEENETAKEKGLDNFNYTKGFTDQFFLGKIDYLKSINYNIDSIYSKSYNGPAYGGNCFEKRIVAHLNFSGRYNCIYKKNDYYIHNGIYH